MKIKVLVLVFAVGVGLRFMGLAKYPVSMSMDEVAIGYNAYSILKTGRDEWGMKWPLAFKSVGDYKPPVDVYLTVPSIYLFGLNEFAVRAPVALMGSLAGVGIALAIYELSGNKKMSLGGGLWMAISPWHVHFSRGSFEAITALTFLMLGVYFYLRGIRKKSHIIFGGSVMMFSLSVWAYHAQRLFVPMLFAFLIWVYRKELKFLLKDKRNLLVIIIILLIFSVPFIKLTLLTEAVTTRALSTSVLRERSLVLGLSDESNKLGYYYKIFRHVGGKYLNYYDLRYWFFTGGGFTPAGYMNAGLFYFFDLLLIPVGIYKSFFNKDEKLKKLAIFWFFTGPIPASLTMNEQHSLRLLVWMPFFALAASEGMVFWYERIKKKRLVWYGAILLVGVNILYFGDMYFRQQPRFYSEYWQYGYEEIAKYACENKGKYERIVITDTFGSEGPLNTGTPYLYYLFYCKYDPVAFQKNRNKIDNIIFRRVNWINDQKEFKNSLIVGSNWDFGEDEPDNIIKRVEFLNGKLGFYMVEL